MDWSASTGWWLAAGVLVAAELATGTFYLLMLALGAAAGAGLGVVLVFVGVKMVLPSSVYPESWGGHFPTGWSLGLIVGVIGASMVASLVVKPKAHSPGA